MALESHTAALSAAVSMKKRALGPLTDWVASLVPPCNASVLTGVRQGKDASYSDERPCSGKDTFGTKARHAGFAWKVIRRLSSARSLRAGASWVGFSVLEVPLHHALGVMPSPIVWKTRFTA